MIQLTNIDKNVLFLKEFFEHSPISFCDLSIGAKYLWRDEFKSSFAIEKDTLILKEDCKDYKNAFYYPIGKDVKNALVKIEEYAKSKGYPLMFCCVDNLTVTSLIERYKKVKVYNDRSWSDYIYDAESFKAFVGKKYSGQRNHINKFNKLYPNGIFKKVDNSDIKDIFDFLNSYEKENDFSMWTAREKDEKIRDYIENFEKLCQVGGLIKVDDKVVGISFGEVVGDTLIVHIEKGLKEYEGVYPKLANEFAKAFAIGKVAKINREEDCGDMGLRISKLQYHPIEVKEKNIVIVEEY